MFTHGGRIGLAGIADHFLKFWDPRMPKTIFAHLDAGGAGLDPNVRTAVPALQARFRAH